LEFVRVTTSPTTAYLFWRHAGGLVEVTKASQFGSVALTNDPALYKPAFVGLDGVITDNLFVEHGFVEAVVRTTAEFFVITRTVAKGEDPSNLAVGLLEQRVTRRGKLLFERFRRLAHQPSIRWRLSGVR
jgi:hypothetical protein